MQTIMNMQGENNGCMDNLTKEIDEVEVELIDDFIRIDLTCLSDGSKSASTTILKDNAILMAKTILLYWNEQDKK